MAGCFWSDIVCQGMGGKSKQRSLPSGGALLWGSSAMGPHRPSDTGEPRAYVVKHVNCQARRAVRPSRTDIAPTLGQTAIAVKGSPSRHAIYDVAVLLGLQTVGILHAIHAVTV